MGVYADLKKFLTQPSFITMAVAFVVGIQVGMVVNGLVADLINPLVAAAFHTNFASLGVVTVNGSPLLFGALFGVILNFLIVLVVVFFAFVYPFAKYEERKAAKAAKAPPTTRPCPFCKSTIDITATKCAFCTSSVPPA